MATYTVTNTFVADTTAVAAEVNENFTDVLAALNDFDGANITDGTITSSELGTDCVTGAKIADDALDSEHYTDGSIDTAHLADDAATAAKIADLTLDSIFGAWNDRDKDGSADTVVVDTVYQAATDGFVVTYLTGDAAVKIYTDGNATPTTIRTTCQTYFGYGGPMCPVRKNDYWKVEEVDVGSGTANVYWLPIGE